MISQLMKPDTPLLDFRQRAVIPAWFSVAKTAQRVTISGVAHHREAK